jgi:putative ABC transport system permease protein
MTHVEPSRSRLGMVGQSVALIGEAWRIAWSQPVPTLITGAIVAGTCAVILATTGQTVQAEQQVLAQIDAAGTRSIVIQDTQGSAGITAAAVDRIARLSGVEWVIGLGPAFDVRPAAVPGGRPAAVRRLYGTLPAVVLTSHWDQAPGTLLVGRDAQDHLVLQHPVGGVTADAGDAYAIVGWLRADEPLAFLNRSLLAPPDPDPGAEVRTIHLAAVTPQAVAAVADASLAVLNPQDPTSVGVQTSENLAQIRAAVQGQLGRYGRSLVTLVLAAGLSLTALTLYSSITARRRDFGRRRALGASRPHIVALVTLQTFTTAVLAAAIGTIATVIIILQTTGQAPDAAFTVAIPTLAALTATAAAIPPALVAAYRDPVRILRIP